MGTVWLLLENHGISLSVSMGLDLGLREHGKTEVRAGMWKEEWGWCLEDVESLKIIGKWLEKIPKSNL